MYELITNQYICLLFSAFESATLQTNYMEVISNIAIIRIKSYTVLFITQFISILNNGRRVIDLLLVSICIDI